MIYHFLSGAIMMSCFVAGLFFARFFRSTRDRFFGLFAVAFALLGAERIPLLFQKTPNETHFSVYLIRLVAFLIIIYAVYDKNRKN